jgi:hypothetical protein
MAQQVASEGWRPGTTAVMEDSTLDLSRMTSFFITRQEGLHHHHAITPRPQARCSYNDSTSFPSTPCDDKIL